MKSLITEHLDLYLLADSNDVIPSCAKQPICSNLQNMTSETTSKSINIVDELNDAPSRS